jgi:site-specific DNA-methyltransferase (adenine-specific)
MKIDLRLGDCLEVLKTIPDNSIDSVVTDPPYGLSFMGKKWDYDVPSVEVWTECLRVLKPGGHLLSFAGSRTYHRMAVRIEDAGFEIRDQIMWVYGSGFPKSHNIGKAIDKIEGNEREVVGERKVLDMTGGNYKNSFGESNKDYFFTKGNNDWEGWGTALKPAHEPIVMARKPLSEKSIAENVLKHGTGGINIDGSRIEIGDEKVPRLNVAYEHKANNNFGGGDDGRFGTTTMSQDGVSGRFPANIIFDEEAGQLLDEQSGVKKSSKRSSVYNKDTEHTNTYTPAKSDYRDDNTYDDKGGASRFFYCPKAAKSDRNEGLDHLEDKKRPGQSNTGLYSSSPVCVDCGLTVNGTNNHSNCEEGLEYKPSTTTTKNNHPTVKPTDLMRYLINLVTPPNGTILDPFMGSGSTGKAAVRCGVNFIGIEKEQEYMDIASARIEHEKNKPVQTKLFDGEKR